MAEVHIIDIDGEQWDIKDLPLNERVAVLEEAVSVKDLPDETIELLEGYTASVALGLNHYRVGKVHFMNIRISHLAGNKIGTTGSAFIGSISKRPVKETSFILYDYVNKAIARCFLNKDGYLSIGESPGVVPGNNTMIGELIFAEP